MSQRLVRITYIQTREVFINTLVRLAKLIRLFSRTHAYEYMIETFKLLLLIITAACLIFWVYYIMEVMEAWAW